MVLLFYRAVNIARDKNSVRTWDQIYGHSQDVLSRSQVVVAYKFLHRDHIWQFAGICMQIASCCRLQVLIQGYTGEGGVLQKAVSSGRSRKKTKTL